MASGWSHGLSRLPSGLARRAAIATAVLVGIGAFIALDFLPATCPTRLVLSVPCPTCGMTRAARAVLSGDFQTATALHPLWPIVFSYLAYVGGFQLVAYVREGAMRPGRAIPFGRPLGAVVVALLVLVWIARFFGWHGGPVDVG